MAESTVQLPPNSTGAKLRTELVDVGAETVHQEVVTPAGPDGTFDTRFTGGKTPIVATVTASGDTTVHTPAAGKAIVVHWVYAVGDPDESSTPLIKVLLGADELYRVFGVSHYERFVGDVDAALVVNLSSVGSVAFTAHIEEV